MADVDSNLFSWSTTAASNKPLGTTSVGSGLDDNLREIQKVVRTDLSYYNSAAVASAGTVDLGAQTGNFLDISGTTTITAFGTVAAGVWKVLRFQGALTLTHNATSLILPSAANITTAANDRALMYSLGSGNWVCAFFERASGQPIVMRDISTLTAETTPATDDLLAIYDTSETANNKMAFSDFFKIITSLTAEATVVTSDEIPIYDVSESAANKATIANVFQSFVTSQSDQETGTSNTVAVTPGRQHYHPSAAKGWVRFTVAGAISSSYNVTSITDHGTGDWTVNWTNVFSSTDYAVQVTPMRDTAGSIVCGHRTPAVGSVRTWAVDGATTAAVDPTAVSVVAFGDQ